MQLHRLSLTVLAASLLLVSTAACGGASCPQGRVKNVDGVCVRDQIADFVECINNAGGKSISREQALRIAASAGSYAGASYDQREAVRSQYEGPNERNQLLVIDNCVRMTQGAEQSPAASPALDTQLVQAALDERSDEMFKQRFLTTLTRQPVNDALCQARHRLPRGYTFPMNSCSSLCGNGCGSSECGRKYDETYQRLFGSCVHLANSNDRAPDQWLTPDEVSAMCCPIWSGSQ